MVPQLLLEHDAFIGLDYGAMLLYGRMLNRASLSAKNAKDFTDKFGRLYIIYTVESVMEHMRCCNTTAIKMLKQLEAIGLIERKKQGQGKPAITYVKDFSTCQFLKCKISTSINPKFQSQDVDDVQPNYKDLSNHDSSIPSYPIYNNPLPTVPR